MSHIFVKFTSGEYLHLLSFKETGIAFFLINYSSNIYNTDIPYKIYAFDPFEGNTEKGITFGNSLSLVESAYGTPERISSGTYYYDTLGISFGANDTDTLVEEIYIYEPSQSIMHNSTTHSALLELELWQTVNTENGKYLNKDDFLIMK